MRTRRRVRRSSATSTAVLLLACAGTPAPSPPGASDDEAACNDALELEFAPETLDRDEAYVCFGFDRSAFSGETVEGVRWTPPAGGAYMLHHAILYAVPGDFPDGPVICDEMPDPAVGLHVWSLGGDDLTLPRDTGLALPEGTERFVVEAHTLRVGAGSANKGRVRVCKGPAAPAHTAALLGTSAPVPAIRPMHEEISEGDCVLGGDVHLFSVWPHMHRVGREISATLVRSEGETTPLVELTSWDFANQKTYALDVDARSGDAIRVRCVWENPGTEYVLPGPKTENEMCNAGFIAWPAASAFCQ